MASAARKLTTTQTSDKTSAVKPVIIRNGKPKGGTAAKPKLSVVSAQTPVHESNELFSSAFQKSKAPVLICDKDWTITFASDTCMDLASEIEPTLTAHGDSWKGFSGDGLVGAHLSVLFSDEPQEFKKVAGERHLPYTKAIQMGPEVCEISVDSIEDAAGKLSGFLVTLDLQTKRLEHERKAYQLAQALDGSSVCVMVADTDLRPFYLNDKLVKSFKEWEPEFQKLYGPGFQAGNIIGRCIDEFHKNPSHQRKLLANESIFPYHAQIQVGPLRIELAVNAIRDKDGKVVGYCTEWNDVTERLLEEEAYKTNVQAIADRMEFLRANCATDLAAAMDALSHGDLTVTVEPRTPALEIPPQPDLALMAKTFNDLRTQTVKSVEAYNQAQESLGSLIAQTQVAVTSIAEASTEVMTGNDDLAQRTEEQAASLEETASSMEQMTSTVKQNADNARQANQLAMQARESAEKGGQVVSNAVSTMAEINAASKRIADIITVIDEIAFQTNLLALNAAVEAARVGEQGRGFAVVAAEVRNLAGRSATAAKEIKGLVQDSVQKVQEGSNLVNMSGNQLEEIVTSVKKVADIIAEISAAAQEQSQGIEQVNKAIIQMDQITQQNAALVEEASAASQSMNQQAEGLQVVIEGFQIDDTLIAQMQAKVQAELLASSAAARKASQREPSAGQKQRPKSRFAAGGSAKPRATVEDLDDFEEF